ncbi:Hsp70 family protein [Rickettsiaceae bacterium]|nr:Hsp70 family protein [Rickettsiaceae bacterium]
MQIVELTEPSVEKQKEDIIVGIDFGTTNSLIAISQNYHAEIIKMDNGKDIVPSTIGKDSNGKISIGENDDIIRSIKRVFAKSSKEIKNNTNLKMLSEIFSFEEEMPRLLINGKKLSIPLVASEIFKYLKEQAETSLSINLEKAVISVPAYFDDSAKGQVLLAAKLAGFEVMRLIAEPTAAAYAYGLNKSENGTYLVYDFGGGTFDTSILNMHEEILQVVSVGGDNMLGGDDIDLSLAEYIAKKINADITKELILKAKSTKENLSHAEKIDVNIGGHKISISRVDYQKIISPIIDKTIKISKETLYNAEDHSLDGIILVGGSTRIPLISKKLKETFGVPIFSEIDQDRVVAIGAAMQAENLSSQSGSLLIDVVPLSFGLELYGGLVEKLIMRNTSIPFSVTKEFTTHVDNQTGMKFHIVQGEREKAEDCRSLAHFELTDIPPMKFGMAKIEVIFSIDVDGILSVTARDKLTSKAHNIDIKPSYGMDEKKVNELLNEAFENAQEDHEAKLLIESRQSANNLIDSLEKAISETPDILSKKDMAEIKGEINSLQKIVNLNNRDNILIKIDSLNKLANIFIQKHLDKGVELYLKNKHIDNI